LEQEDVLLTLGEIAVTLAALSGVAGILAARPGDTQLSAFKILLLRNVALIGMIVAALALLPLTFRGSAISSLSALRICSTLAMCCWLGGEALFFPRGRAAVRSGEISASAFGLGFALNAVAILLFAYNVLAPTPSSPRRYVLGLMCALAIAGINFLVAVLNPRPPAA
jgi:hypothetical protein